MSREEVTSGQVNNIADELHYVVDLASRMEIIKLANATIIECVGQVVPFWLELNQGTDVFYRTKSRRIVKSIHKDNSKYDLILCNTDFIEKLLKNYGEYRYYILIDNEPTNYVIQKNNDGLYFVYLEVNDDRGFFGEISDIFRFPIADYRNPEFVRYIDIEPDSMSNVIMAYKTRYGWFGGSHRAMYHFKVGETIEVPEDSVLLSHGHMPEYHGYEKETERINEIKQLIKDGKIEITDFEIAKKLAVRLCDATG